MCNSNNINILSILRETPQALARIRGSEKYPDLKGIVTFYQTNVGVIVTTQISGLPKSTDVCSSPIFAFHIHEGERCTGNETDSFADALSHYNPDNCPHPYHAGDMPPLFGVNGFAFCIFLTDRFSVQDIIGKTVIIHSLPDDFTTQPSGNSGTKIACGIIDKCC